MFFTKINSKRARHTAHYEQLKTGLDGEGIVVTTTTCKGTG